MLDDTFTAQRPHRDGRTRSRGCGSGWLGQWPHYEAYQERTDREIPVVVLERR